ncbi:head GIN domain-containing protein [Robiginitalea sp. SC105]|uniref:head GIN domain-containing protein n=1 Tax=Robiginitalea sp. SC105 TaxID=2762332 RepID=UPI00163A74C0|nr:head GIN domain-containing protein [Robiginitalea sp. SC105]MBC2838940.1 DUF2807 domain-containing protein [Robiginitalea sp. SC105]
MKTQPTAPFALLMLLAVFIAGCGEKGPDCLQAAGEVVREELAVPAFTDITVFENVQLVLRQGTEQQVLLETGKNLRSDVSATVTDGTLELRDENGCNLYREYGLTTFYVTTPDLGVLRSSTGWPIRSEGVLAFDNFRLVSESFNNPETVTTDGAFDLEVATRQLRIVANGIAFFRLRGSTDLLQVTIAAGDSRVEAPDLDALRVSLNHRGSNEILVRPINRIDGVIRGYGDVLSYNRPDTVEVEEAFRGRLIFVE